MLTLANRLKALRVKLKEQRHHLDEVDKDLYVAPSIEVVENARMANQMTANS